MRRRNNFAKRCAVIQSVIFLIIIVSVARVINAPKKLISTNAYKVERYVPNIHSVTIREDNINSNDSEDNDQAGGVEPKNVTLVDDEVIAKNITKLDDGEEVIKTGNGTEPNKNITTTNNATVPSIPEICIGLDIIYSNSITEADAYSHWWKTVNSLEGIGF